MNKNQIIFAISITGALITIIVFLSDIIKWFLQNELSSTIPIIGIFLLTIVLLFVMAWKIITDKSAHYVKDELDEFRRSLKSTNKTFDCMAFNIEGHLPVERHREIAKTLKNISTRLLFFDLCTLSPEKAFIELLDGNKHNPGKPYNELINCLACIEDTLTHFNKYEKNRLEIRLYSFQSTMRYYSFDDDYVMIAPYFSKTYRVDAKCYSITNQNSECTKYYIDAFNYAWKNSEKLQLINIKQKINEIEKCKIAYLHYIESKT